MARIKAIAADQSAVDRGLPFRITRS